VVRLQAARQAPAPRGVGGPQPNHWHRHAALACGCPASLFLAAWWFLSGSIEKNRPGTLAFEQHDIGFDEPFSKEIQIGSEGTLTAIESPSPPARSRTPGPTRRSCSSTSPPRRPSGFGAEVELVLTAYDGGESWSEGSKTTTVTVGGISGGKYLLQIHPQRDATNLPTPSSDLGISIPTYALAGIARSPTHYNVRIHEDVYLTRYSVSPSASSCSSRCSASLLGRSFEKRRWRSSDYS
jgi:hypothetical protein